MNRRGHRGRVDGNHAAVRDALRKLGAEVHSTAMVGDGFPDFLACFRGVVTLLEVKMPGQGLTRAEAEFALRWPVKVVSSAAEAIAVVVEAARPVDMAQGGGGADDRP